MKAYCHVAVKQRPASHASSGIVALVRMRHNASTHGQEQRDYSASIIENVWGLSIVGGLDWCSIAPVTTEVPEISGKLNEKKSAFTWATSFLLTRRQHMSDMDG
jgi:hypothetical protein